MYKHSLKAIMVVFAFFLNGLMYSQFSVEVRAPFINYNYENTLRFEFPINNSAWKREQYFNEILRTQEFVPTILANIQEIGYESLANLPLDIDIVKLKNTVLMHIYRNRRPVTYHTKDSTLLFHGFHKLRLVEAGKSDIFVYFDSVEELKKLILIDFENLKNNVFKLIKDHNINNSKIFNSTDLFFTQMGDETLYTGHFGYTTKYRMQANVGLGAASVYDKIGGSLYAGIGLGKFSINNYGEGFQKSKFGVEIHSMFFNNLVGSKVGLNYLNSNFKSNLSLGFGGGLYGIGNPSGMRSFQEGLFLGHIIERNNFRFSMDYLFSSDFFKDKNADIPILLNVGFYF